MSEIDYESLRRATERLREALAERQRVPDNDFVRDSVVQRFEFTYELCAALLRRFLKEYKVKQGDVYDLTFFIAHPGGQRVRAAPPRLGPVV